MMALTRFYTDTYAKAAMISNDLGHGVTLADNRYAQLAGCNASEMTETCICYQNENLADRMDSYYNDGCELVVSDIPGFGVGALEHVYHGLTEKFPGRYELAPFTVIVEPRTVSMLRQGCDKDLTYLYNTQLVEADLLVLNKCDLLTEAEKQADLAWLKEHYPLAECLSISAKTGEGIDVLAARLREGKASMRRPDIGYGGPDFASAMSNICEYYNQYTASVCCQAFNGTNYLLELAGRIQGKLIGQSYGIPHMKLLAWSDDGDYAKVDLLGADRDVEINHSFAYPSRSIHVIVNLSGFCDKDVMDGLVSESIAGVSANYHLDLKEEKKEFFGMN